MTKGSTLLFLSNQKQKYSRRQGNPEEIFQFSEMRRVAADHIHGACGRKAQHPKSFPYHGGILLCIEGTIVRLKSKWCQIWN